jgi:uncharacterized membrane protein YfcA
VASKLRAAIRQRPLLRRFARGVYLSIFSVYGNAMLLLVALSFGKQYAVVTMTFFAIVMARTLALLFKAVHQVNRELARNSIPWK